jgi:peptide/nickel transport system permease protein
MKGARMATTLDRPTPTTKPWSGLNWLQNATRSYLVQKLLKTLLTIFIVVSLTFFLIRLLPGNPIEQMVAQLISQYGMSVKEANDQVAALFAIDLNSPLLTQYLIFLKNTLRGDFGNSVLSPGTPVTTIILRFLPWTIFSVGLGLMLSFVVGTFLGMLIAYRRDTLLDHILTVFGSVFSAVPNYLIGLMIIVWLGIQWGLVPIASMRGALSPNTVPGLTWEFFSDALFHASLLITTYFITTVGVWMLSMKSSTINTLGEDYVTVAKARGLTDWRIITAYVGRNAALPLFAQLALSIGFVVGGSLLIETIFVYQGIGQTLFQAINRRDYTVMQGIFLVITLAVILSNFLADLLYSWLDPRIKLGSQG